MKRLQELWKTRNGKIVVLAVAGVIILFCCILPAIVPSKSAIPISTATEFISPLDALYLTQTAQPTNAPYPTFTPEPTSLPEKLAWTACTQFIDQQLKLSTFDAQKYNPSGVTALKDNQYRVQIYYAKQSDTYICTLLHRSDGKWQLLTLDVK